MKNWICAYTDEKGLLAVARFSTYKKAVKFSKGFTDSKVAFDSWGI